MQEALNLTPPRKSSRMFTFIPLTLVLFTLGATAILNSEPAHAQNIDQGKSAPRLFSDSCAACHHNARGLAHGRFRLPLFLFLQQHYAANSSSAWELTSYLESLDTPPQRGRPRATGAKPTSRASRSSLRPPAPVPNR
jgi:hypothetical protein